MKTLRLKLLGLARAADNNEHMLTNETFRLVRDALDATHADETLAERIELEKRRIAPMCADCASPCGRTADPDASIYADRELLKLNLELLQRLLRCGLPYYGEQELNRLLLLAETLY